MPDHKIRTFVEETSIDTVRIMTTGRIELGASGRTVAANVKRLREAQGLTLRALATKLREHGRPLSADALNKIENGASPEPRAVRRVDVDDLVVLSVVFGVSPLSLLLPHEARGPVEITGAGMVDGKKAWRWGQARTPLTYPEGADAEQRRRILATYLLAAGPVGIGFDVTTVEGQRAAIVGIEDSGLGTITHTGRPPEDAD